MQSGNLYAYGNSNFFTHIAHIINAKSSNTRAIEQQKNIATSSPKKTLKPATSVTLIFRSTTKMEQSEGTPTSVEAIFISEAPLGVWGSRFQIFLVTTIYMLKNNYYSKK
jgi:hypothetical protein